VHYEIEFYLMELYYMEYFSLSTGNFGRSGRNLAGGEGGPVRGVCGLDCFGALRLATTGGDKDDVDN
jgi:hypothetical protein